MIRSRLELIVFSIIILILGFIAFIYSFEVRGDSVKNSTLKEFSFYFPEVELPKKDFISFKSSYRMPSVLDPGTNKLRKAHGYCKPGTGKIVLNKNWWKKERIVWHKKKVLMHELGHCLLGLMHPANKFDNTIMNSIITTANKNGSNWGYLMGELRLRWLEKKNDKNRRKSFHH